MLITERALDSIRPYPSNPRKITDRAVVKVAQSIREFGWRQPIVVDEAGVIIIGHTRRLAAQRLGLAVVPVHEATGLTEAQVRALRIADNRTGEEAMWDTGLLIPELASLGDLGFNLSLTGFDAKELLSLTRVDSAAHDVVPDPPEKPITRPGDTWILGRSRLMCGDATDPAAMRDLVGDAGVHMVFTDPPYNVDYDPEARASYFSPGRKAAPLGKIANDKRSPAAFRAFLDAAFAAIDGVLAAGRALYVCHADMESPTFMTAFSHRWKLSVPIVWRKNVAAFGRQDYQWLHEKILYGWKPGAAHVWHGDRKQTTVWDVSSDHYAKAESDTDGKYVHPTQKPVALITRAIDNSSDAGEVILDPFGGSGSTLIAAHKAGRQARLMEIDPRFCDVIVRRWENFAGEKARRA